MFRVSGFRVIKRYNVCIHSSPGVVDFAGNSDYSVDHHAGPLK